MARGKRGRGIQRLRAPAVVLLLAIAACGDITGTSDRPLVQRAQLTVTNSLGSAAYTVTAAGGNSPSPILLAAGANQVSVSWQDAGGSPVATNGYGAVLTRLSSGLSWNSGGTLTVTAGPRLALGELRLRHPSTGDDAFAADLEFEVR